MKKNKFKPWPNQTAAVNAAVKHFSNSANTRGQIIMACATGKTEASIWTAMKLKSRYTLVLVPSLALISQTMQRWLEFGPANTAKLLVCSKTDFKPKNDEQHIDLADLPQPPTTNLKGIRAFLRANADDRVVVFCTYHSSSLLAMAQRGQSHQFDLIICDEAHRVAASDDSAFRTVLNGKRIKGRWRLFMTATPKVYTSRAKKRAAEDDLDLASMDDPKLFGQELYRYSFAQAIADGRIADYKISVIVVNESELNINLDSNEHIRTDADFTADARDLAAVIATLKSASKYKCRRTFAFLSSVARSQNFTVMLQKTARKLTSQLGLTRVSAEHMDGTMDTRWRSARLEEFQKHVGFSVISNCRCLGEGVDAPLVDSVVFADPKRSVIDIVQAVGRTLRTGGKSGKIAHIVVPLIVPDDKSEPSESKIRAAFTHVISVVNAMKMHDERLVSEINSVRHVLRHGSQVGLNTNVEEMCPHLQLPFTSIRHVASSVTIKLFNELFEKQWVSWTKKDLQHYMDAAAKIDPILSCHNHRNAAYAAEKLFGSWDGAKRAFGININITKWSRKSLITYIKENITIDPVMSAANHYNAASAATRIFGSWSLAKTASGVNGRMRWDRQAVIKTIIILSKNGIAPLTRDARTAKYGDLHSAALRIFETWEKACLAAGLKMNDLATHRAALRKK